MAQENGKGPADRLREEARGLAGALAQRAVTSVRDKAMTSVRDRVQSTTGRLTEYATDAADGASPGLKAAVSGVTDMAEGKSPARSMLGAGMTMAKEKVSGLLGGGGGGGKGGGQKLKVTNIVESIDVGVPIRVAYNQWTQFSDFPTFMKKVENVGQPEETKTDWKAQVFWSHRAWRATIIDQRPDERIVWRSEGDKGHVDGTVTFHELTPTLTKILIVLEYHPQGLFEHTGNIWRAQGRRTRLELKHFRRHVMTNTLLNPDEVEGWRGVIEDSEVVKDHETALAEEQEGGAKADEDSGDKEADSGNREEAPRQNASSRKRASGDSQKRPRAGGEAKERVPRPRESTGNGQGERASQRSRPGTARGRSRS